MKTRFSICIPNYNYASYMDLTIQSLKSQIYQNIEVLIADNCSTDNSIETIRKHISENFPIKYEVNHTNIGFAGNLDKVGSMATAHWMIMLSSDDVVKNDALRVYDRFINLIGDSQDYAFCSTFEKINSDGKFLELLSPAQTSIWFQSDIDAVLSLEMGFDVYKVKASDMLKRCFTRFLNPFNFASTCYPRAVYEIVGGYGGGRLYNPDKWFHWKIMAKLEDVYYLDIPLFQYRWHNNNQANQQQQNQVLKYWMDEYRNTFEISDQMLLKSGLNLEYVQSAFIRRSIFSYVYSFAKSGNIPLAKRLLSFGYACYPNYCNNITYHTFKLLLNIPILNILIFKMIAFIRNT